jgi:prepilin-type N-terminal cleavage/methylation domain-containing protein
MVRNGHATGIARSRDEGFTLSELLVVMGLLGIVLSAAYMFIYTVRVSADQSNREAALSRSVTLPMQAMERLLMQNSGIEPSPVTGAGQSPAPEPPGDYTVTFTTDQNADDHLERHTITAVRDDTTGVGYVVKSTYAVTAAGATIGAPVQQARIADNNANIRDSVPLFRFYTKDGVLLDPLAGGISTQAAYIVIQMRITLDGKSETHTDTVVFRNR